MNKLNNIVNECLRQHKGGEEFFDALDEEIKDIEILDALESGILWSLAGEDVGVIVSGKFGKFFLENNELELPVIHVQGGLRNKKDQLDIYPLFDDEMPLKWIFVDDSYYSGSTKEQIRIALENAGRELIKTYVVYDGSPVKLKSVLSLYRYYK